MTLRHEVDAARTDPARVLLEGIHALKHAVRFGATIQRIVAPDPDEVQRLLAMLAPDVELPVTIEAVDDATWTALVPRGLPSPVLSVAQRPAVDLAAVVTPPGDRPVVLLDAPTHLGNVGAVIRVAAAAAADAVVVRGAADPWHPTAVRGAAGLQFALPVDRVEALLPTRRPLVAVDPDGAPLGDVAVPRGAVLAFGTERHGLGEDLLDRADLQVAIPMRAGVSSLNLATAVAVMLYAGGLR